MILVLNYYSMRDANNCEIISCSDNIQTGKLWINAVKITLIVNQIQRLIR